MLGSVGLLKSIYSLPSASVQINAEKPI